MVTVPRKTESEVKTNPVTRQLQQVATPSAAFGGGTGRALTQAAGHLDKMARNLGDLQARKDDAYALDISNRMENELNDFLYNPEEGLLTKKGLNGMSAGDSMSKKLEELKKKYLSVQGTAGLHNSLNNSFTDISGRYQTLANRHAQSEIDVYENEVLESRRKLARDTVATDYYDQDLFNSKYQEIQQSLKAEKSRLGKSDEWYQQRTKEEYSGLRVGQIQHLANSGRPEDVLLADSILKEATEKGHFTLQDQQLAEKTIRPHIAQAVAQVNYNLFAAQGATKYQEFDGAINFVINELEGGSKDVAEPNDGRAIFGINSNAHPQAYAKIKKMVDAGDTAGARQEAKNLYQRDYWDAYDIGELPEHLRMVALSTVINHRAGFKDDVIKGIKDGKYTTVQQILEVRNQEYIKLARNDPDNAKGHKASLSGWQARLQKESKASFEKPTIQATMAEANRLKAEHGQDAYDEFLKIYEQSSKVDRMSQIEKESEFTDIAFNEGGDDDMSIPEKTALINELELKGKVSPDYATKMRRYLSSKDKIDASTNADEMAQIVTQMYDLNAVSDLSAEDYLVGVRNIKLDIAERRANGLLSKDDEQKLNNQIKTLTSAKISEATNMVAINFNDASEQINQGLPPELRGIAIRDLFYAMEEERKKAENNEDLEDVLPEKYGEKAQEIIDRLGQDRRAKTFKAVQNMDATADKTATLLSEKGYTMDDVKQTAQKYGMTEQQVINRLMAQ